MSAIFHERQQFARWCRIVIVAVMTPVTLLIVYGMTGSQKPPIVAILAWLVGLAALGMVFFARLHVTVDEEAVAIFFRPFHRKPRRFPIAEIAEAFARRYEPINEFGGWGIRDGDGWAYNASGNEGVQLVLTDGRKILIGSQRMQELEAAIRQSPAYRAPRSTPPTLSVPSAAAPPLPRSHA